MTAISSTPLPPEASAEAQSSMEAQARLTGLGGLNGRNLSPEARDKKLREACEGFESIFIQKMWQEMRNTIPQNGMMHGREERFWQDMYDQELSKSMTKAGGIGLADMMYEQLSRNLVSASRSATGAAQSAAFMPQAAPLMQAPREDPIEAADAPVAASSVSSIYDGEAPVTGESPETASGSANEAAKASSQAMPQMAHATQASLKEQPVAGHPLQTPKAPETADAEEQKASGKKVHARNSHHYPDGQNLAKTAMRDAGDKLGSRGIRPALYKSRQAKNEAIAQTPPLQAQVAESDQTAKPGTPESLKSAVEAAKKGSLPQFQVQPGSLNDLVARVQNENSAKAATQPVNAAPAIDAEAESIEEAATTVFKTTFITNIPSKQKSKKSGNQPIRMLNVDNVSVNSKAGKGLAAYHAAQESAQPVSPQPSPAAAAQAPIQPLTAPAKETSFTAPPLKANSVNS